MAGPERIYEQDGYYVRSWHNGYYRVCWSEGRQTRSVSTGCRVPQDAEAAVEWAKQWLASRITEQPPAEVTVNAILDRYESDCIARNLRGLDGIKYAIKAMKPRLGALHPSHLSKEVIRAYTAHRREQKRSDGTIRKELVSVLRTALGMAMADGLIAKAPIIEAPAMPPPRDRLLTKDEVRSLLASCGADHIKLFVTIAATTAARRGAILELQWDQIDFDKKLIDFGPGHGRKRRAVAPINDTLLAELEIGRRDALTEWVVEYRGLPVNDVKTGFRAAVRRAGIGDVSPHMLRHYAASHLAMAGISLDQIADLMQADPQTVHRTYRKFQPGYLRGAVSALELG